MYIHSLILSFLLLGSTISFAAEDELGVLEKKEHLSSLKDNQAFGKKVEGYDLEKTQSYLSNIAREIQLASYQEITSEQILSLAETLKDTLKAIEESYKSKKIYEEGLSSEKQRLKGLFGEDIDKNEEIIAIRRMLEKGEVVKKDARPSFFDGLFYVMEKTPGICSNVKSIDIELERKADYSKNIYELHSVLNTLILGSDLQSIKLNFFKPETLVATLATLKVQNGITHINLANISLGVTQFDLVLRSLPSGTAIEADLSQNNIDSEENVALLLYGNKKLKSLKIISQQGKPLDLEKIAKNLSDGSPLKLS